jgi:hypothetical protein
MQGLERFCLASFMISNYHNYGLFDKYLNKVKNTTVVKFGSFNRLQTFLHNITEQGNVLLAVKAQGSLKPSFIEVTRLIKSDKYLAKCVNLAQDYATEMVEAVLYDRAINGYEELTLNKHGECVARKKKYCSKSLLEYLKANSPKYHSGKSSNLDKGLKGKKNKSEAIMEAEINKAVEIPGFEIESYGEESKSEVSC